MRARDALAASRALTATHAVSGRAVLEVVAETTIVVDAGPELVQVRLRRRGLRPARDTRLHALRPDDVEPARDVAGRLAQHHLLMRRMMPAFARQMPALALFPPCTRWILS